MGWLETVAFLALAIGLFVEATGATRAFDVHVPNDPAPFMIRRDASRLLPARGWLTVIAGCMMIGAALWAASLATPIRLQVLIALSGVVNVLTGGIRLGQRMT